MRILVTGGAGFIGSAVIRYGLANTPHEFVNLDKLTYAGNLESLRDVENHPRYHFEQVDICDGPEVRRIFEAYRPDAVMHLAAESHVDRSIDGPSEFIQSNIVGTYTLLEVSRRYHGAMEQPARAGFRFHHVSTDEVFGSLGDDGMFVETTPYDPSSPYSASKAASDHLVRAWHRTFGLPIVLTNCSNNYGPYQFPEKLIPLMIINALSGKPLPVYGKGEQVRDWLFVDDHACALLEVLTRGRVAETYNVGGHNEKKNIDVVHQICSVLDELVPDHRPGIASYTDLIEFVKDRPGHDQRYAIDASKIRADLGWAPEQTFETGIRRTVEWYLANESWWRHVLDGSYRGERLGLGEGASS